MTEEARKEEEARRKKWINIWKQCPEINQRMPESLTEKEIQEEIIDLTFNKETQDKLNAHDSELLTITIKKEKSYFFDFLKAEAKTEWEVRGYWKGTPAEGNWQIEVEFLDNKKECIGNRVIHLIDAYNKNFVKEDLLYARTVPVEEGTLYPERRTGEHLK